MITSRFARRMPLLAAVLSGALIIVSACDGEHLDQPTVGPALHVVATNVDGPGASLASDGLVQIAFDRYLHPVTTGAESVILRDAQRNVVVFPRPLRVIYDPVARLVTVAGPEEGKVWLTEGKSYELVLPVAPADGDVGGFRALDRAALEGERILAFSAGKASGGPQAIPKVDFCADVLPLFADKCTNGTCHAATGPNAASLVLETSLGVNKTAISRAANGSNSGALAGRGSSPGRLFGVDMPIVDPNNPGNSWLMYKIELAPLPGPTGSPPGTRCEKAKAAPAPPFRSLVSPQPVSAEEHAVLSDYIRGLQMPYPVVPAESYVLKPLTFEERERVRLWIAGGAATPECGACAASPDAGPGPDAGAADAAADTKPD